MRLTANVQDGRWKLDFKPAGSQILHRGQEAKEPCGTSAKITMEEIVILDKKQTAARESVGHQLPTSGARIFDLLGGHGHRAQCANPALCSICSLAPDEFMDEFIPPPAAPKAPARSLKEGLIMAHQDAAMEVLTALSASEEIEDLSPAVLKKKAAQLLFSKHTSATSNRHPSIVSMPKHYSIAYAARHVMPVGQLKSAIQSIVGVKKQSDLLDTMVEEFLEGQAELKIQENCNLVETERLISEKQFVERVLEIIAVDRQPIADFSAVLMSSGRCWPFSGNCLPWGHVDVKITASEVTVHRSKQAFNLPGCGQGRTSTFDIADCRWIHVQKNSVPVEQLLSYMLEAIVIFLICAVRGPHNKTALITSDCGKTCSSTKWP